MNAKRLLLSLLFATLITDTYAGSTVVGDYMAKTPDETCKITSSSGLCSGTMISSQFMLSARHCFKAPKSTYTITCNIKGKAYKSEISSLKLSGDIHDTAVVKLKNKMPTNGMKLLKDTNTFVKSASINKSSCAVIGYGISNDQFTGIKHGVMLDRIDASSNYFDEHHLVGIIQARLNDTGYIYKLLKNTSVIDTAIFKALKKAYYQKTFVSQSTLESLVQKDPDGALRFSQELDAQVSDEYQSTLKAYKNASFNYMLTSFHSSNLTHHTSGFLPGDSGGTFACKNSRNTWVLVGIISNIKVEKKMAIITRGDDSYYSPIEVSTMGGSIPLVGSVSKFIKESIYSLGGNSKTLSQVSK